MSTATSTSGFDGTIWFDQATKSSGVPFGQESSVWSHSPCDAYMAYRFNEPDWLRDVLIELWSLEELPDNWNSYGGKEVSNISLIRSMRFARRIAKVNLCERPIVSLSPDGYVVFCWRKEAKSLEVEVLPDGTFEYLMLDSMDENRDREGATRDIRTIAQQLMECA